MMTSVVETTSSWSAIILVGTTCVVLIYLIMILTQIFTVDRYVKSVLEIKDEEVVFQTKEGGKIKFKHHKFFFFAIAFAYGLAILLSFWPLLMIVLLLYLIPKIIGKVRMKKA